MHDLCSTIIVVFQQNESTTVLRIPGKGTPYYKGSFGDLF